MTQLDLFLQLGLLVAAGLVLGIGGFVRYSSRSDSESILFFRFTISVFAWIMTNLLFQIEALSSFRFQMALVSYSAAAAVSYYFYAFSLAIHQPAKPVPSVKRHYTSASLIAGAVFALSAVPGVIATGVTVEKQILTNTIPLMIYGIVLLIFFTRGIVALVRAVRRGRGDHRSQAKTVLWALSTSLAVGFTTNLILPLFDNYNLVPLGPTGALFLVFGAGYAILTQGLFDVRPFVARTITYVSAIVLTAVVYFLAGYLLFTTLAGVDFSAPEAIFLALFGASASMMFIPVVRLFKRITNTYFFQDVYDSTDVLNRLNSSIVQAGDLRAICSSIVGELKGALYVDNVVIYLDRQYENEAVIIDTQGGKLEAQRYANIFQHITSHQISSFVYGRFADDQTLTKEMSHVKMNVLAKLSLGNELLGFIAVGNKLSGGGFTSTDAKLISIVSAQTSIALQNALRFQEIEQFNKTLERKIADATKDLRGANQKLKTLDETKDDFISMASHQLRTPLTSVKGYLSLVIEGDAGKITPMQHKLLTQAFFSSQRMVYLIADLLNVSRLKTGKFIIDRSEIDLGQIINEEIEQLHDTAAARQLTLHFDQPKHFPILKLDETKTRQVIMNFIDNAIYYTPAGGNITVNLVDKRHTIDFTVVDTGIGVPRSEQHHLFTKFYRAPNAQRARPDGTGLGLFMAKKVIIAQGGAVIFKSVEGKGSTFGFSLEKAHATIAIE